MLTFFQFKQHNTKPTKTNQKLMQIYFSLGSVLCVLSAQQQVI